jgi:hypothetical protein
MTAPRRRWSFSLRTLFLLVTVLAIEVGIAREYPPFAAAVGVVAFGGLALTAAAFALAGLLYVVCAAISGAIRLIARPKDSPAAQVDRPESPATQH